VSPQVLGQAVAKYQTAGETAILKEQLEQARLLKLAQRDNDPYDRRVGVRIGRRGGL
jgi:hypothetical protein